MDVLSKPIMLRLFFSSTAILAAPTATASETQNSALGMGSMPKTFCAAAIPLR